MIMKKFSIPEPDCLRELAGQNCNMSELKYQGRDYFDASLWEIRDMFS